MDSDKIQQLLAVNAADPQTNEARRQACQGKKLLWLTSFYTAAGYNFGVKDMLDELTKVGVRFWVVLDPSLESDRKMAELMEQDGLLKDDANGFLFVDMTDADKTVDRVFVAVKESGIAFDAVFGTSEHVQQLAGELAQRLGLPGNAPDAYMIARDKRAARDVCRKHGIAAPKYDYVYSAEDVDRVAEVVGFPCVIKPSSGCGSLGVVRCDGIDELRTEFERINKVLESDRMFSWNPGCDSEHGTKMLVEQYIDGEEFDVDVLMWNGEAVYANVLDNWPCIEPYFQERASNCPSAFADKSDSLITYSIAVVKALGFTQGCYHVEVKYSDTEDQPLLIEVNPRMGGGGTRMFHRDVYGVDLLENFFMSALGVPINPPRALTPQCARVYYDVNAMTTGVLAHTRWLEHIESHANVTRVHYYKKAGDNVRGLDTGMPEWVANIHVKAPTIDEALELMRSFEKTIECPIIKAEEKVVEVAAEEAKAAVEA